MPETKRALDALHAYDTAREGETRRLRSEHSLGPNDVGVLRLLLAREEDDAPLHPGELARALGISSAATTALLDRLEKQGLIRREADASDRRSVAIVATVTKGSATGTSFAHLLERQRAVLEALDVEDKGTFERVLRQLTDSLGEDPSSADRGTTAERS